jgi:hypothetical protein
MNDRTSFAACGVYLSKRNLRISLSRDVTEAIIAIVVEQFLFGGEGDITRPQFLPVYCVAGEGYAQADAACRH